VKQSLCESLQNKLLSIQSPLRVCVFSTLCLFVSVLLQDISGCRIDNGLVQLCSFLVYHYSLRRCPVLEGTEKGVKQANRPKSRYERNSSTNYERDNVVR